MDQMELGTWKKSYIDSINSTQMVEDVSANLVWVGLLEDLKMH